MIVTASKKFSRKPHNDQRQPVGIYINTNFAVRADGGRGEVKNINLSLLHDNDGKNMWFEVTLTPEQAAELARRITNAIYNR